MRDCAKVVRFSFAETGAFIGEMKLDSVPVIPGVAADDMNIVVIRDAPQSLQRLTQNRALLFQLKRVLRVLVMAAATACEVLATRCYAL